MSVSTRRANRTGHENFFSELGDLEGAIAAAKRAEQRLHDAIDAMPHGVVFLDEEGRYILWNDTYAEIYAKSADLLVVGGRLADTLHIGVARGDYPEAEGREEEWIAERLELLANPGARHEQMLSNGHCIMIEERKTADGGTIGLRVDITEMKEKEKSFRLLFQDNPVPLLVYDYRNETIGSANEAALQYFGYEADEMRGLPADKLFVAGQWDEARGALGLESFEKKRFWHHLDKQGRKLESILLARRTVFEGQDVSIVSVFDVTERRRAEARIAHMALHDELTGLPNRVHCREYLQELLAKKDNHIVVAMIDLDNFKPINDSYGHATGDHVLAEAALRMKRHIGDAAMLCRIGGDEFAIIFDNPDAGRVEQICASLCEEMTAPVFAGPDTFHIGATVGLASSPEDSSDAESLIRYADLALHAAKSQQRGSYRHFDESLDIAARERADLERDFREAVMNGSLAVYYQPLIDLSSGEIDGYEALLRWYHAERGFISPEIFIPMAEEIGLIDLVGQHVLMTACNDAAAWPSEARLAVNVSPMQFQSGNLLNLIVQALAGSGLTADRLELEITEAVLMEENDAAENIIRRIRDMGVGVSMDDFGTGYSSLSYLLRYPFSKVKIDKSFVMKLMQDPDSRAIIKAVIGLGHSLGLSITAEGIEDEAVLEYLRAEGCTQGQGYYFGKPAPVSELFPSLQRKAG